MSLPLLLEDKSFYEQKGITGPGRVIHVRSVHVLLMLVFSLFTLYFAEKKKWLQWRMVFFYYF